MTFLNIINNFSFVQPLHYDVAVTTTPVNRKPFSSRVERRTLHSLWQYFHYIYILVSWDSILNICFFYLRLVKVASILQLEGLDESI